MCLLAKLGVILLCETEKQKKMSAGTSALLLLKLTQYFYTAFMCFWFGFAIFWQ